MTALLSLPNILLLVMMSAIYGAVVDRNYTKKGGLKPTKAEWTYFFGGTALCLLILAVDAVAWGDMQRLGRDVALVALVTFPLWELNRWRTRREHRLAGPPAVFNERP